MRCADCVEHDKLIHAAPVPKDKKKKTNKKNHYGCSLGAFGFRYADGEQKEMLCKACNTQVTTSLCKLPSQTPLSFPHAAISELYIKQKRETVCF